MPQPRIFISHSSKDAALTGSVCELLSVATGDHPGYEVLLDSACLQAGEEWPVQLHAMMAHANAGLILLTRSAMCRPDWVRNETYILAWRASLDPAFKLFYALLDDVEQGELSSAGFDPAHLKLLQALNARSATDIACEVKALGPKDMGMRTPFEDLARKLGGILGTINPNGLCAIADKLGAPPVPWRPNQQSEYVERIAARLIAGQLGAYGGLSDFINELKGDAIDKESLKIVLRWVAPYWLPPDACGRFSATVRRLWVDREGGSMIINGQFVVTYTTWMFVYRARPFEFQCQVAEIEAPTHRADAIYYKRQICEWLKRKLPEDYDGLGDDAIVHLLSREKPFLFVPLPAPVPDKDTLRTLREWFGRVVFLLWTGSRLQDVDFDEPPIALRPEVDGVREETEYLEWRNAIRAIRA